MLDESHQLRRRKANRGLCQLRPMKAVSLEAFREQAESRAVPPQDFDPIGGLDPEHEQGAVERIGASVTHERRQPIGPFAEVDRLRRQNNARIGWNHLRGKRDPMTTRGYAAMAWGAAFSHFQGSNSSSFEIG